MNKQIVILALLSLSLLANTAQARRGESEPGDDRGGDRGRESSDDTNDSGKSSGNSRVRLISRLSSNGTFATTSRAKAEYRVDKKESRFKITLHMPFANDGVTSVAEAEMLKVTAVLSRAGTAYAECKLRLDTDDDDQSMTGVEFKLDIRKKRNKSRLSKQGSCNINLSRRAGKSGLPAVRDGDTVILSEQTAGIFKTGEF